MKNFTVLFSMLTGLTTIMLMRFFLDNRAWSDGGHYSRYMEEELNLSCEWRFSCRVLHITDEKCGKPEIVKSVGESPEQYPDFDDEYSDE